MSNKVTVITGDVLAAIDQILPFLKQALPVVEAAGGPIGLGLSAAQALLPLIDAIPMGGTVSVEAQQARRDAVEAILNADTFSGPEWQLSPLSNPVSANQGSNLVPPPAS